jgi:hypothetical protein
LEITKLSVFEIETEGANYVVRSDFLTRAGEWILRHAISPREVAEDSGPSATGRSVRFTPTDISRLDDQAQKQRIVTTTDKPHGRLSQLLRTLGDHLDRTEARAFRISWAYDSASIDYQLLNGENDSRDFTAEKLDQLGWHARFRRLGRTRTSARWPGSWKHR